MSGGLANYLNDSNLITKEPISKQNCFSIDLAKFTYLNKSIKNKKLPRKTLTS